MSELKFTPEYIAKSRKANGGPWVFSEPREALDEIERLQSQLASRDALIERLVEAGDVVKSYADTSTFSERYIATKVAKYNWDALVAEYRASKDGGVE